VPVQFVVSNENVNKLAPVATLNTGVAKVALSRDQDGIRQLAQQGQIVSQANDLLKEPLVLEFLGLSEQVRFSESELEAAIISQIEHFLLELGKGFLFEARQKRFTFDDEHRATYADALLTVLAERLTTEFGKGLGRSNIAYCRSFYLTYRERVSIVQTASGQLTPQTGAAPFQIVQTVSGQSGRPFTLSWSHYVFLLGIKKTDEHSFYEIEATQQNWTLRELRR